MITRECEQMIDELVQQHGYAKVKANLETLIGRAKWNDWQSVCNYLDRIGRRAPKPRRPARVR